MIGPAIRRTTFLAGTLAAALALAACSSSSSSSGTGSAATSGPAAAAPKGTLIKVGLITSLTGPQASSTAQTATVAPAWADWITANGGIDGHPVKTVVVDDKTDPATGQAVEQQLAADGVTGIIVGNDDVISAYDSAAIGKGIPLIGGVSYENDWRDHYPGLRFKLDAEATWSPELLAEVAGTETVDTIDFKGQYGLDVKEPDALVPLYERVVELFPDAILEDPHDLPGSPRSSHRTLIGCRTTRRSAR